MAIFKKRETLTQNIAYMGIMAAINAVFVIITTYALPILFFLLIFVLPLTSTIVTLFCKKKYFIFYALATIGICLLVTMAKSITDTLFYVIPSVISGFAFGMMIEKKIPSYWILLSSSLINFAFTYLSIPIIKAMYGIDIIQVFAEIFALKDFEYINYIVPCFVLLIGLMQALVSFFVVHLELPRLGFEINNELHDYSMLIGGACSALLTLIFALTYKPLSLFFGLIIIYFGVYFFITFCYPLNKLCLILSGVSLFITLLVFAASYNYVPKPLGILLVNVFFVLELIIGVVNNCLLKRRSEVK